MAVGLTVLLGSTVAFVFVQSSIIFGRVGSKVVLSENARHAFEDMERCLATTVRTADMDFFQDKNGNGHYDPGEELGGQGLDLTEEKRLGLPLPPGNYHFSFTLRQPDPYAGRDGSWHRHDSIYFRSLLDFDGKPTAAIVEYALTTLDWERPRLEKRIWRLTGGATGIEINGSSTSLVPIAQEVCPWVTDATFEIFVKNKRQRGNANETFAPGRFYSAKELVSPPLDAATGQSPFPPHRNYWAGAGESAMVMCAYDETHSGGKDLGLFARDERGLFHTREDFPFPMLEDGDEILLFGLPTSSGLRGETNIRLWRDLPAGRRIELSERIPVSTPGFPDPCQVTYRAAWLPSAIRVTLKVVDEKSRQLNTFSRCFWLPSRG